MSFKEKLTHTTRKAEIVLGLATASGEKAKKKVYQSPK